MPIQPMNFANIQPQGNSFLRNLGSMLDEAQKYNQSKKMFPEMLQQQQLENAIKQIQAQYAQPMAEGNLQKLNQENQWNPQVWQSEIGLRGAQTNKMNTMTPLEARELSIKNQYAPRMSEAEINEKNAQSNYYNMGGSGGGVGQKQMMGLQHQIAMEHPDWNPQLVNQAAGAYINGESALPNGMPLPNASGIVSSYVDQIVKQGNTAQGLNQQRFARTLDTVFDNADKVAPNAFKFAGAAGKLKGGISALSAQRGNNDPEYRDYLIFTRQVLPSMASEMLRTGGANSTDSQKLMAIASGNPISFDNNPALAMEQYNFIKGLYKNIGKTISGGVGATRNELRKTNPYLDKNYNSSNNDLSSMSDEELKRIAGGG